MKDEMSNEDLLREGECSQPHCIEPAGHDGPHTFPPGFIDGVRRGVAALNEGKITPWEEVERELSREEVAMKPKQMIDKLMDVFDWIESNHPDCKYDPLDSLRDVLAALEAEPPCACGGRKPLAKTGGFVREICGDDGIWRVVPETFQDREWPKAVEDLMRWKAVVQLLLPAEGGAP